jgi:hypothetical protein
MTIVVTTAVEAWVDSTSLPDLNRKVDRDDFQCAVLINWFLYKKHKSNGLLAVKFYLIFVCYFLKITSLNLSSCHAIHFCLCDRKLAIMVQRHTVCSTVWNIIAFFYGTLRDQNI